MYQLFPTTLTTREVDEDILIEFDECLFSSAFKGNHTALDCPALFKAIKSNSITRIVSNNSSEYIHIFTVNRDNNHNYFQGDNLIESVVLYRNSVEPTYNVALVKQDYNGYICVATGIRYTLATLLAMYDNMQRTGVVKLDQSLTHDFDIAMSQVYKILSIE